VALSGSVVPRAIEEPAGVTAIETKLGWATESTVNPVIEPETALMVALPIPVPVANPLLSMVATPGAEEVQPTELVRSCVLPSENVPVAVNCWFVPSGMEAPDGATAIDTNTGAVTVSAAEALIAPRLAAMLVVPCARLVASPALFIVATEEIEELQLTTTVRSCMLPSE
jgi:hypothetical protein